MKKTNFFVSAIMLAFATSSGALAQTITGGSSHSPVNGGARILEAQGDTPANPAIGFHSTASTPGNPQNDGGGGNGIFRPNANEMGFATGSIERMRIISNGQIGIGTSTPSAALHLLTGTSFGMLPPIFKLDRMDGSNQAGLLTMGISSNGFSSALLGGGSAFFKIEDPYGNSANRDMGFSTNGAAAQLVIKNNGFIGMGTETPTANLHSIGTARLQGLPTSTSNSSIITTDANGNLSTQLATSFFPSSTSWLLGGNSPSPADFIGTLNNEPFKIYTSGTEKARITDTGEMGIGTISPTAQLEVTSVPTLGQTAIKGFGKSTGIYGEATDQTVGQTEASILAGNKDAIGVFGKAIYMTHSGNGTTIGVAGSATANTPYNNMGTYGEAKNANGYNTGVYGVAGEFPVPSSTPGIYNSGVAGRVYENKAALWNRAIYGSAPISPNHFAGYFEGKVAIVDGTEGVNKILTSDATGLASWADPATVVSSSAWSLTGNTGTNPAANFLGTTDAQPLIFKTSGSEAGRINAAGLTGFGTTNPIHKLQVHDGALMLSGNVAGFGGPQLLFTDDATTHPNGKWAIEYLKPIASGPGARPSMGGLNFWKPWNASNPPGLAYNYTLFLKDDGKIGMGVTDDTDPSSSSLFCANALPNGYRLYVNGGILTTKVKVANYCSGAWADYVFAKDYKLKSLAEVETFIKANKHLPNIPSGDQIEKDGLDLADMQAKQMEKIEELTLYMIEMKKEIDSLKKQNESLQGKISKN